jgi:hypothetical protein
MPENKTASRVSAKPVWTTVSNHLVNNILKNALYVMDACKCKTLGESHLKAVSLIQANILQQGISYVPKSRATVKRIQSGGNMGYVLPSEYFGNDSGKYIDIAKVEPNEVQLFADTALARAEHPMKSFEPDSMTGGAVQKVTPAMVKASIKNFQAKNPTLGRVSKGAVDLIVLSVQENVKELVVAVGNGSDDAVMRVIKSDPKFVHLKI